MTDERPLPRKPEPDPTDRRPPPRRDDDDDTRVTLTSWDAPLVPRR